MVQEKADEILVSFSAVLNSLSICLLCALYLVRLGFPMALHWRGAGDILEGRLIVGWWEGINTAQKGT